MNHPFWYLESSDLALAGGVVCFLLLAFGAFCGWLAERLWRKLRP